MGSNREPLPGNQIAPGAVTRIRGARAKRVQLEAEASSRITACSGTGFRWQLEVSPVPCGVVDVVPMTRTIERTWGDAIGAFTVHSEIRCRPEHQHWHLLGLRAGR